MRTFPSPFRRPLRALGRLLAAGAVLGTLAVQPAQAQIIIEPSVESQYLPGRIQAEDFDNGDNGDAYYDTTAGNSGGEYRKTDVDIAPCPFGPGSGAGCLMVSDIAAGEWLRYTAEVQTGGFYTFRVRVSDFSSFHIELDGVDVTGVLTTGLTLTGWSIKESPEVRIAAGLHEIKVVANGSNFALDWFAGSASPLKHPVIYQKPVKRDANATPFTPAEIARTFSSVIYHRSFLREGLEAQYEAAGFQGPFPQYIIANELVGPRNLAAGVDTSRFAAAANQQLGCAAAERTTGGVYSNNVTLETGAFCQIQDSIAGVAGRVTFDHDLNPATPAIQATEAWFLHKPNGDRYVRPSSGGAAFYPNPGNQHWRDYFIARLLRELEGGVSISGGTYAATGADGIYLDNVELSWNQVGRVGRATPSDPAVYPVEFPNSGAYASTVLTSVLQVEQALNSNGRDYLLWGNLIEGDVSQPAQWNPYISVLDGALKEDFVLNWGQGPYTANVNNILTQAETWLANGGTYLAASPGKVSPTAAQRTQELRFSLAAFLLVTDAENAQFFYREGNASYAPFDTTVPEYAYRLGLPLGPRQVDPGNANAYTRRFTCGSVRANLVNSADVTITYDPTCAAQ